MLQNVSNNNKARNRRRNNEHDKVPLLQKMQDEELDAPISKVSSQKFKKNLKDYQAGDSSGEPFHVIINIGELPTSFAQTTSNFINSTQNSSAFSDSFDESSNHHDPKTYPHSSEDVMAQEANFDGGAHVAFIYSSKDGKKSDFSDSEDENRVKFMRDEDDLCGIEVCC